MEIRTSPIDGRQYRLSPGLAIEWQGQWYPAHWIATAHGTALVPDAEHLPIAAIVMIGDGIVS